MLIVFIGKQGHNNDGAHSLVEVDHNMDDPEELAYMLFKVGVLLEPRVIFEWVQVYDTETSKVFKLSRGDAEPSLESVRNCDKFVPDSVKNVVDNIIDKMLKSDLH